MANVLTEFVGILVAGIQELGTGIATGVSNMATALFLDTTNSTTTLSAFGGIIAIFGGLALAIGITTRVYMWVTSLGK